MWAMQQRAAPRAVLLRGGLSAAARASRRRRRTMATAAAGPPPAQVVTRGRQLLGTDATAKDMIAAHDGGGGGGAYTTLRTVAGGAAVVEFDFQVKRLNDTAALLAGGDATARAAVQLTRHDVAGTLAAAFQHFDAAFPAAAAAAAEERRATLLLVPPSTAATGAATGTCTADPTSRLYCHVEALPPPPSGHPIAVEVRGQPRDNPLAKDAQWIADRAALERARAADVHEVVLASVGGGASDDNDNAAGGGRDAAATVNAVARAVEGTQTNFFAVTRDGTVCTAGEGVLEGTVRKMVLEECARHSIPVRLEAPAVNTLTSDWGDAFLTSTSRLVLPVDEVRVPVDSEAWPAAAAATATAVAGTRSAEHRPVVATFGDADSRRDITLRVAGLVERRLEREAVNVFDVAKARLRANVRRRLRALTPEEIAAQSEAIAGRVAALDAFRQSRGVGVFLSMPAGEVDTGYLLHALFRADRYAVGQTFEEDEEEEDAGEEEQRRAPPRKVYVPRVTDYDGAGTMSMLRVSGGWSEVCGFEAHRNRWGIPEPSAEAAAAMEDALVGGGRGEAGSPLDLDVVIVPCVAFDRDGRRCGHGGGFYDRFVARLQAARAARGQRPAALVGVCLREQLLPAGEALPATAHDWRMDAVVTPAETLVFSAEGAAAVV